MYVVMLRCIAVLFLLFVCANTGQAQDSLETAVSSRGDEVLVERNPKTGSAHRVYGINARAEQYGLSVKRASIPALARALFEDYAEVLKVDPGSIELTRVDTDEGIWFVSGIQTVNGVPVYGAEVGFTLNAEGEVVLLGADVYPEVNVSTAPAMSAAQALAAAQAMFETDLIQVKQEPLLIILPQGDPVRFHLTWQLRLSSSDPPQDVTYFVDAQEGTIVHSFSNLLHFANARGGKHDLASSNASRARSHDHDHSSSGGEERLTPRESASSAATITITGQIRGTYWPEEHTDPTTTAGYRTTTIKLYNEIGQYITSFSTDANGSYSKTYSMAPGIYILQIPLQSSYVQVRDGSNNVPYVNRTVSLVSGTNTVNYTWPASDRANVKRHAERMRDYFTGAPFNFTAMNYQMQAHIDEPTGIRSQAAADGTHIYFGDAGGLPWEETAEIIRHEYTHNVVNHVYNGWIDVWRDGSQASIMASAMDEGLPDYYSSSTSTASDPHIQGETVFAPIDVRDLDNNNFKFTLSNGHYWNSQVISGAVWDVRQALGSGVTDRLAFRSMQLTPRARTFSSYGYNMVVADHQIYSGSHESTIRTYFTNHGISIATYTPPPAAPTNLTVSGSTGSHPLLSWTGSSGATGYKIYRCANTSYICSSFFYIGSTTSTSYTDLNKVVGNGCGGGGDYITQYYVKAYNTAGESGASNTATTCTDPSKGGVTAANSLPTAFALKGNYPNPFNPQTEIRFDLAEAVHVRLVIYDVMGREVVRLVDKPMEAGFQSVRWEASWLPSGVYLYRLEAGDFLDTKQMILMK